MGHTNSNLVNDEFEVISQKNGEIWLLFYFLDSKAKSTNSVRMRLSKVDWNRLITFLLMTKDKKSLHKDNEGYSSFVIDTNKPGYFNLTIDKFFAEALINSESDEQEKKRIMSFKLKQYNTIKKSLLTTWVCLNHGKVEVSLIRDRFVRFRAFALKAHKHLFKEGSRRNLK